MGAKSASTFLQYNFHNNKKLNFLGIIEIMKILDQNQNMMIVFTFIVDI